VVEVFYRLDAIPIIQPRYQDTDKQQSTDSDQASWTTTSELDSWWKRHCSL